MNPFQAQQQIRHNATELSDYLTDLRSWGNDLDKKQQKSGQKDDTKPDDDDDNDLPPIRNQSQTATEIKQNVECFPITF